MDKPDLENIKKDNIFKVPENYFEDLPMKIQSRIAEESKPQTQTSWISQHQLTWSLSAAMIVLVFGIMYFMGKPVVQSPEEILAQVSTEDMVAYLEDSDLTVYDIVDAVDVNDLIDTEADHWEYLDEDISADELDEIYDDLDYSIEELVGEDNTI